MLINPRTTAAQAKPLNLDLLFDKHQIADYASFVALPSSELGGESVCLAFCGTGAGHRYANLGRFPGFNIKEAGGHVLQEPIRVA
jgi:hypothetical protein